MLKTEDESISLHKAHTLNKADTTEGPLECTDTTEGPQECTNSYNKCNKIMLN